MQGITWLQQQNIVIDKECKNSINEFNNYTFQKDKNVKKIDVDLSQGKVLVAFDKGIEINFEDIKKKILANGQNATGMQVVSI